jgi:tRNA U34 2-thiouridine synthase MnmA/TrmU
VVVGDADQVDAERVRAEQVNFIAMAALTSPLAVAAKIRHGHEPAAATIEPL